MTIAKGEYRSAVRDAQARLRAYKRDLLNLDLTEAQIHEIIPDDASAPPVNAPKTSNGSGAGNADPQPSARTSAS